MNSIVVARFQESLDWILKIPADYQIFIYNKGHEIGDPRILEKASHIITRPNNGREAESYLFHIMTTSHSNTGFTVFTQGDPLEHSPDFLKLLSHQDRWHEVQALSWRWRADRNIPPIGILKHDREDFIGEARVRRELFSLSTWNPLAFNDYDTERILSGYRLVHQNMYIANLASHFFEICGFPALAENAIQHRVGIFSYGAIFAVKNDILTNFTESSLTIMYKLVCEHLIFGYVIERLWLHLFGEPFLLPRPTRIS